MAMLDDDIGALLNDVLPLPTASGVWDRVLADATGHNGRRLRRQLLTARRRTLALAAVVLALIVVAPVAAIGSVDGWWFSSGPAPSPSGAIVPISNGEWNGQPWTLSAYRSGGDVCVAFTPNGPSGIPATAASGHSASVRCSSSVAGVAHPSPATGNQHEFSFNASIPTNADNSAFPGFVVGLAAEDVEQMDVLLTSGRMIHAATIEAPPSLGVDVRFFVIPVPVGASLDSLIARDVNQRVLERQLWPSAPPATQTGDRSSGVDVGGP